MTRLHRSVAVACLALAPAACARKSQPTAAEASAEASAASELVEASAPLSPSALQTSESLPADPRLLRLKDDLQNILERYAPDATVEVTARALVARSQTQMFMVHDRNMRGEVSKKAVERLGPNQRGFLLELTLVKGTYSGQGFGPQTLTGPYWQTFVNVYPMAGRDEYLAVSLAFGASTEGHFLKQLKEKVAAFASARTPSP